MDDLKNIEIERELSTVELRKLAEVQSGLNVALSRVEYIKIINVYEECVARILKVQTNDK